MHIPIESIASARSGTGTAEHCGPQVSRYSINLHLGPLYLFYHAQVYLQFLLPILLFLQFTFLCSLTKFGVCFFL